MNIGPNSKMNILKNEPLNLFVFLNKNFKDIDETELQMTYFDSTDNSKKQ